MSGVLLQTKLHIPVPRRGALARPRLTDRLSSSVEARLTLVSAPAGFGKTMLLSEWSSRSEAARRGIAWVSLDQRDNDPASFWAYVTRALGTLLPGLDDEDDAHQQALLPSGRATLELLLNALESLPQDAYLVLDDYHVIDSPRIHDEVAFLLDHLPARAHLVLATRVDPPLQLARLRARGQLVEVRAADLRFTADEAAAYLHDSMGLTLTDGDLAALDGRIEGWAAALQLAALSMQGRDDLAGFVAGFSGDDRYIVDYLAEEVLQRLTPEVRRFLLHTSVLSRFSGPLCDAVTGRAGSSAALESLDRQNLFVVALDDHRRWYRYHHLFADVLRTRLLDEQPDLVPELHLRASRWLAADGDVAEAVQHAVSGAHWQLAADLIERAVPATRRDRREATLRLWLESLPQDVLRARPTLSISYVGCLMSLGELTGVESHLLDVERWLADPDNAAAAAQDDGELRTLAGTVAMYRAGQARLLGDVPGTLEHAQRAMDLAGDRDHLERGAAAALLGLAHWSTGDVEAATRHYAESVESMDRAGHVADLLGCTIALADLQLTRGRPDLALAAYRRALSLAEQQASVPRGTADAHTGLAALLIEGNELAAAVEHLHAGDALGPPAALPQNAYRWRVAMARVRELSGDVPGALALLDEAEQAYDTDYSPDVRPVGAIRARLQLACGETARAAAWARSRGLSVDDDLDYLREYEHLTLARSLLSGPSGAAGGSRLDPFLDRLLAAAQRHGRTASAIDVLLLQTRSAHLRGDPAAARARLRQALALAEPHAQVRTVLDHGPVMVELLRSLGKQEPPSGYVLRLLAAASGRPALVPVQHPGPDRLSEREIDVLRLLASDLDGPGIARSLVVSVNTVRTHTKSIYTKLGVNSRRAAVRRARDLGLLSWQPRG